jgi:hypothetical protein
MPFALRHHYRFPVFSPVRYEVELRDGYGTVTNLSHNGWRIHGNLPVNIGDVCSLKVRLATMKWVYVSAGIVRWVEGEECGIETVVMNDEAQAKLDDYIQERVRAL